MSPVGSRPSSYTEPSFFACFAAGCCVADPKRKEKSEEVHQERGSETADMFAIRASLPQGDLFSRSFSSTSSISARDLDEPRDSLRGLLRSAHGSQSSLIGDTVLVPARRDSSLSFRPSAASPEWSPKKLPPRKKPPPRDKFDDF